MLHAKGSFDVTITPQTEPAGVGDPQVGRMAINKTFSGDLQGSGRGQMLAYQAAVEGSAVYIALEKVDGVINGRRGSFVLQHSGSMVRGEHQLSIRIVSDSGTDELQGISGQMLLTIEKSQHFYHFEYTLP